MSTADRNLTPCCLCKKSDETTKCDGCRQSFCSKHIDDHRKQLFKKMDDIKRENDTFSTDLNLQDVKKKLSTQIRQWEKESIEKIQSTAKRAQDDLNELIQQLDKQLSDFTKQLKDGIYSMQASSCITETELDQWGKEFGKFREDMKRSLKIQLVDDDSATVNYIKVKKNSENEGDRTSSSSSQPRSRTDESTTQVTKPERPSRHSDTTTNSTEASVNKNASIPQSTSYPSMAFALNQSTDQDVKDLFKYLVQLEPMDKNGPMSGRCNLQTSQMEQFLERTFGFRNIPGKSIVQGVKAFALNRPPSSMDPKTIIHFPADSTGPFIMKVQEIIDWQRSYRVYADKGINGMDKVFLYRALQGQSQDGEEAFRMKFVIRISTCPILMEFDAKIISRKLNEEWPHRIKLVSVTGIDFAGRKHDVDDILYYVSNWTDVYVADPKTKGPALLNERDFMLRKDRKKAVLHEKRLLDDLTYMAKLRLRACDEEGVQVVVETGIGLGVFAGEQIGIADQVQITSALAIKAVLEQFGSTYKNIRAVVFALPNFDEDKRRFRSSSTLSDFMEQFQDPQYRGRIPVLIADQDMHRLTVAIARQGFVVSELNPADSHGVFGEYWQNRGPAVEEKLALTTLGLLVQHHLINQEVLTTNNYHIIDNNN